VVLLSLLSGGDRVEPYAMVARLRGMASTLRVTGTAFGVRQFRPAIWSFIEALPPMHTEGRSGADVLRFLRALDRSNV
jgi:hypothetical protein